jgi:hypothetical protein
MDLKKICGLDSSGYEYGLLVGHCEQDKISSLKVMSFFIFFNGDLRFA